VDGLISPMIGVGVKIPGAGGPTVFRPKKCVYANKEIFNTFTTLLLEVISKKK